MNNSVSGAIQAGRIVPTGAGGWVVRCRNRCITRAVPNAMRLSRQELVQMLKQDGWSAPGGYWTCPKCGGSPAQAVEQAQG